jgi:hypothetical protein
MEDMDRAMHPHPTLSEAVAEAALASMGTRCTSEGGSDATGWRRGAADALRAFIFFRTVCLIPALCRPTP